MSYVLAAFSSALYVLGYAGFDLWPLALIAFVPVLYAVDRLCTGDRDALRVGLCFGALTQLGGYGWLVATLREFSGLPWAACVLIYALLCVYQGGQLALFAWLAYRIRRRGHALWLFAPLCLGACELVYPLIFPSPFAASLHELPLVLQLADIGGPTLISIALALLNATLYAVLLWLRGLRALPKAALATSALIVAASCGYGALRLQQVRARTESAPRLVVGIVQANMSSWAKREQRAEGRRRHLEQSRALEQNVRPALLVWPETALHYPIPVDAKTLAPWLAALTTPVLLGAPGHRVERGRALLYNSAFLADADGRVLGRADKQRLIPFAEYIPLGEYFPWLYELSRGSGQLSAGSGPRALPFRGHRLLALICYEDVLPGLVRDSVLLTDPHLLLDLSNDSWFGRSREPYIHLALAKLRAIEHRRYFVRAGNSGISAVIDPAGRVVAAAAPFTRQNLSAEVAMLSGQTVFGRLGDWPGWLALLLCALALLTSRGGSTAARAA